MVREPDVDDTRPESREPVARRRICRVDRGVGLRAERVAARADAEAVDARLEVLEEIGDRPRPRVRVGGIEPRNRLRDDRRVADRARQRPRHGERGVAATGVAAIADEAERRLEPDHAAERRGDAGRSAAVGADVERAHQRGRGRRRAATRPAGHVVRVPRVPRRPEEVVVGGDAAAELVRRRLADDDRPGRAEALGDGAVDRGHVVAEHAGAVRRAEPRRVEQVLHAGRDAVQRAAIGAGRDLALGGARRGACLLDGHERREGVQPRVRDGDPREHGFEKLDGRERATLDQIGGLGEREADERRVGHGALSITAGSHAHGAGSGRRRPAIWHRGRARLHPDPDLPRRRWASGGASVRRPRGRRARARRR